MARKPESAAWLGRAVRSRKGAVGLALTGVVVLLAAIGPAVAPNSPEALVTLSYQRASGVAWLGGDTIGRDVFSRTLAGGWQLLVMAAIATLLGVGAGAAVGVLAAYSGGWRDSAIMRAIDVLLAFPQLVFALLLVSILGPRLWLIVLAVAISHAPQVARVARAAALDISERDFVKAMQILGVPGRKIIRREILPNLTSVLMVEAGLRLTYSIVIISGLSYLGFGLQPPSPNWARMVFENQDGIVQNPWGVLAPAILIAVLTVGVNLVTDAIAQSSLGIGGRGSADPEAALELVVAEQG